MNAFPHKIKHYRILSVLAAGSTSLLALDESANRQVLLKDLRTGLLVSTAEVETFRATVQRLARQASLPVARTIELLQVRSQAATLRFLVREYRDGLSLAATLERQGRLEPEQAGQLVARIARSLAALHEAGVAHGNLSASNVILDTGGQIQFVDCALPPSVANRAFAAPELATGKPASPASDLYALGALYCLLLTQRLPENGLLPEEALAASAGRADVLRRLLAADPGQRPRSGLVTAGMIEQTRAARPAPKNPAPIARPPQPVAAEPARPEEPAAAVPMASPEPAAPVTPTSEPLPERMSEKAAPRVVPAARSGMQRLVNVGQFLFMTWAVGFLLYTISRGAMTPGKPVMSPAGSAPPVFMAGTTGPIQQPVQAEPSRPAAQAAEDMCAVPAGESVYIDPISNKRERVSLPAFQIDRYEVTNADFLGFTRETGAISEGNWQRYFLPGMERYPVVGVTWEDASAYAKWVGKRLPTAREWQKAAGAVDGRPFPWGSKFSPELCAWSNVQKPVAVDSFPNGKSPFGAYNMAGNVWEWVGDSSAGRRFVMGGSYNSEEPALGILSHMAIPAEGFRPPPDVGFRCAKDEPAGA